MKFVIQRVTEGSVTVDGVITGQIKTGYVVLIGVGEGDTEADADRLVRKMIGLRIFSDENGKINRSLGDVGGGLLLISQFTLYADYKKGNRPSFFHAAAPEEANRLYEYIIAKCREQVELVQTGIFGAMMDVRMCNSGPFTMILDSSEIR